jgi:hypothetical protein
MLLKILVRFRIHYENKNEDNLNLTLTENASKTYLKFVTL